MEKLNLAAAAPDSGDVALANEINQVMKEWNQIMKSYQDKNMTTETEFVKEQKRLLVDARASLQNKTTAEEKAEIRARIMELIEEGRSRMGPDMLPRLANGDVANEKNTGIISLYHMHCDLKKRQDMAEQQKDKSSALTGDRKSALMSKFKLAALAATAQAGGPGAGSPAAVERRRNSIREQLAEKGKMDKKGAGGLPEGNIQIVIDVKATIFQVADPCELHVSLYCHDRNQFISEEYIVALAGSGIPKNPEEIGKLKSIFKDCSQLDFSAGLHVICKLVRVGAMSSDASDAKKEKHGDTFRRPLGCAVFQITPSAAGELIDTGRELIPPDNLVIQHPTTDLSFATIHEAIITKSGSGYSALPKAKGIALGIKFFSGDLPDVIAMNEDLKSLKVTNKLGFPDVILPGEARNDLYVTIDGGEFLQDRKTSAKNVEVTCNVVMNDGHILSRCVAMDKMEDSYRYK